MPMQQKNNFFDILTQKIKKGWEITPFLCMWNNLWEINTMLHEIAFSLCQSFEVDKHMIFTLSDTWESLKIEEVRDFLAQSYRNPGFLFQIFIIENISRMTLQSSNAVLKFFEEPGRGNLIFLTSQNEAGILDTILSRVTSYHFASLWVNRELENKWDQLIRDYVKLWNPDLIKEVFQNKIEKEEAILILKTFIHLQKEEVLQLSHIEQVDEDIRWIAKNNFLPRYIIDKWIFELR